MLKFAESLRQASMERKALKTIPPLPAPDDDIEDSDVANDGGAFFDSLPPPVFVTSNINEADRKIATQLSRSTNVEDEEETMPLQPAQKYASGRLIKSNKTVELESEALCGSYSETINVVAVGCSNGNIQLLNSRTVETMQTHKSVGGTKDVLPVTCVKFRPDLASSPMQNVLLVAVGDRILHMHSSTGKVINTIREAGNKISIVQPREGGELFATAGSDRTVRVYDEATCSQVMCLDHGDDVITTGHSNNVFSLAWNPDNPQVLLSAGWDRSVKVWDLRLNRCVRSIFGPYVCGDAVDVSEGRVLTGSWRHVNPLQLWDLGSSRLLTNLPFLQPTHDACLVYTAKFGRKTLNNFIIAGGSGKLPLVRVYQASGEIVGTFQATGDVYSVDACQSGSDKVVAAVAVNNLCMITL